MTKVNIELTKEGGRYYRARAFWFAITLLAFPPILIMLILVVLNPFWFRDQFAEWISAKVDMISKWRNYTQYKIYLGVDPTVWHTLKGDTKL
ncbi:hypothetical protein UFOVP257_165 [uncultured Caudovirales phage]|uniref:Uncharacterized protein n=1 Tax=uncultured Caudovirales phage TaxID=2100421 RepID=A0A6J5LJ87_9CAUD|nr:hypothetical protein UFOVP257_165 [uncultured Caudovirales phage]